MADLRGVLAARLFQGRPVSARSTPAFAIGGVSYVGADGQPSEIVPPPGGWACFQCGDRFYTFAAGVRHFGWPHQKRPARCVRTL